MHKIARLLVFAFFSASAQNFTPGNIVVTRIGDGTVTISTGLASPVYLDEYSPAGILLHSRLMPTIVSGANKMLTNNGSSTAEGTLNISADGQSLILCGYNAAVGTPGGTTAGSTVAGMGIDNSIPSIINRIVGIVDYNGNINTTTALTDAFDKTNIRSAASDNSSNIWICGSTYTPTIASSGVRYTIVGSTVSTKISTGFDNAKVLGIAGGQLYATSGTGSYKTINSIGTGLPTTTGQVATNLNGIPTGSQISPVSFVFFDMDASISGPDLLYICDDGVITDDQGLNKYSFDGTIWTKQGRLTDDCTGVTGYVDCNGQIVLFVTSNSLANNKIYKFIDHANYNAGITGNGGAISSVGNIFGNSAGLKQVFRGIQMAPGYGRTITATDPPNIVAGSYNKITIKSGANAVLTGNITIADKLVIETGATLDCGNFVITSVAGTSGYFDLQSGGALKIGSIDGIAATASVGNVQTCTRRFNSGGIYTYNGIAAQNTGDGIPTFLSGKLILGNSLNVTLSTPIKITGTIDFHAGRLITTASNIVTLTSSTQYIGYTNSYSQAAEETSFIDGPANFESNATSYKIIPIGKGSHFAPAGITPYNNVLKTYQLEYFPVTPTDPLNIAGGLHHISQLEYWDITCSATNNPDKDAKITLYWSPNSVVGSGGNDAQALPDLRIAHYKNGGTGLQWQLDGAGSQGFATNGSISYGSISANDFASSFSPFTLASRSSFNILPIQLVTWKAVQTGNQIQLRWQVTGEENMDYYNVERSQDAQHFTTIKTLPGTKRSGTNNYAALDENPNQGLSFYRLAMVDEAGKKTYSTIEKIWVGKSTKMSLFPSPAKDFIQVNLPAADGLLLLTDAIGKPIKTISVTSNSMVIDLQNLSAGVYFVTYNGIKGNEGLKFVKL